MLRRADALTVKGGDPSVAGAQGSRASSSTAVPASGAVEEVIVTAARKAGSRVLAGSAIAARALVSWPLMLMALPGNMHIGSGETAPGDLTPEQQSANMRGAEGGMVASGPPFDPNDPNNDKDKNKLPDNAKDMKELSKGEIKNLKRGGEDIHALKGKGSSRYDLFKDKNGDIYQVLKGGKGEPQPTYLNINNF